MYIYIYIYIYTYTQMWTQCTSVLVNKACCHARHFQHSWLWLRRAELTSEYVDSYPIPVDITYGTVIAFRIGTFRVIEKVRAFSLFLSENYERTLCLRMPKIRCNSKFPIIRNTSRTCSVGIVATLWAGWPRNRGSILGRGLRFVSFPKGLDQFWYPNQTRVKWALNFLPSAQSVWILKVATSLYIVRGLRMSCYSSTPPYAFMAWRLINNKGNFTFKISNENMADKRNCETESTLATLVLCIQGVPGGMCQTSGGCSLC